MGSRETVRLEISCKSCGASGEAVWQENENPLFYGGKLQRRFEILPKGFERRQITRDGDEEAVCVKCGDVVTI